MGGCLCITGCSAGLTVSWEGGALPAGDLLTDPATGPGRRHSGGQREGSRHQQQVTTADQTDRTRPAHAAKQTGTFHSVWHTQAQAFSAGQAGLSLTHWCFDPLFYCRTQLVQMWAGQHQHNSRYRNTLCFNTLFRLEINIDFVF